MTDEPIVKRAKLDDNDDDNNMEELVHTVWEHYRNFLDSLDGDEDGEIDELQELIEIATDQISKPKLPEGKEGTNNSIDSIEVVCPAWQSRGTMVHVLLSVACYHLADVAISEYLAMVQQQQHDSPASGTDRAGSEEVVAARDRAKSLLVKSLEWYPYNAATWSMGANFGRMSQSLSLGAARNWYEMAVRTSTVLREQALAAVEDESIPNEEKEWIELLVLNQIVGVQYETEEDDEVDGCGGDDENPGGDLGKTNDEMESNEAENDNHGSEKEAQNIDEGEDAPETDGDHDDAGWYSSSSIEATSRFMCAMLCSMNGDHDRVLAHLESFRLTHRLHPNVWKISPSIPEKTPVPAALAEPPVVFQPAGGVLPPRLYNAMTKVFAPTAAFWKETDYASRGYFSFFHEYDAANKKQRPCNLIEEVVVNHLMPRAQQCLDNTAAAAKDGATSPKICGFEWWAHTRPIKANLGHNLHFDTDESMLDQEGKVTHPVLSSVLYLTGAQDGNPETSASSPAGATIVLDETPDSTSIGDCCWRCIPKDNAFLVFPGNKLHGVLPCPGTKTQDERESDNETRSMDIDGLIHDWQDLEAKTSVGASPTGSDEAAAPNRLTFMVGFWTRNVPATMKHRSLYGPCGPLPPSTEEHSWVGDIARDYDNQAAEERPVADKTMTATAIPRVSPAWELIENEEDGEPNAENGPSLTIPHGIDHRFFVRNAPVCFRESLFEDRETKH